MSAGRLPSPPDFPLIIRTIEAKGISRRVIARRLGVSQSAICRWVSGDHVPNYVNGANLIFLAGVAPAPTPSSTPLPASPSGSSS